MIGEGEREMREKKKGERVVKCQDSRGSIVRRVGGVNLGNRPGKSTGDPQLHCCPRWATVLTPWALRACTHTHKRSVISYSKITFSPGGD